MMKKLLLMFVMMLLPMIASADVVEIDGIYYNLVSKATVAEVTSNPNKYTGDVVIPETVVYNDVTYKVTTIGNSAFFNCGGLKSITIPSSITSIKEDAFRKSVHIEKVIVQDITAWCGIIFDSNPLYYAHHLYSDENTEIKDLIIPDGVKTISNSAFSGCTDITSISIPNSVTTIGSSSFSGCSSIASVIIPNGVTDIGQSAFQSCNTLSTVSIPNSIKSIGYSAFDGCSTLNKVIIEDIAAWCGLSFYSRPFPNSYNLYTDENTEINNLVIPNGIENIRNYAFCGCTNITSVSISNSVNSIDYYAFDGCSSMASLSIPNSVTTIGNYAFRGCSSLTSLSIPSNVTSIGDYAFSGCSYLETINIGNNVNMIGSQAFSKCSELSDVFCFARSLPNINIDAFKDSYIEYATLHVRSSLISSYKDLAPWNTFKEIIALENYTDEGTCGDNVTWTYVEKTKTLTIDGQGKMYDYRGGGVFLINTFAPFTPWYIYKTEIQTVDVKEGVTAIDHGAFMDLENLISVSLPNSLTYIGPDVFMGCKNLETLTIPANVKSIEEEALSGCNSLKNVYCHAIVPPNTDNYYGFEVGYNIENATLYVPEISLEEYNSTTPWNKFGTILCLDKSYYLLTITAGMNGSITYDNQTIIEDSKVFYIVKGTDATLSITANEGYKVATLTINGENALSQLNEGVLNISNVTANTTVEVTFELANTTKTVTLTEEMGTLCSAEDLDFTNVSGLAAYIGCGFNTETSVLTMTRVYDVPAGTGLVLVGTAGSYEIPYSTSHSIYVNLLEGVTENTTISPTSGGYTNYILSKGEKGVGFYKVSETGELAAGKAYLRIPTVSVGAPDMFTIDFQEGTTAVDGIKENQEKQQNWYDLQGRRIQNPTKPGLYILNGKKVVIK